MRRSVQFIATSLVATMLVTVSLPRRAHAEPRRLSLEDAIELAVRANVDVAQSEVSVDRAKLAVLRAQLDRVSVKVDASVSETWNKSNILGPTIPPSCSIFGFTVNLDEADCVKQGGTVGPAANQSPSSGQGLSNLQARINVPIFSGFAVESNVAMRQRMQDAAGATLADARRLTALSVTRYYWALRRLALSRDISQRAIDRLHEGLEIVRSRVRLGLAPASDEVNAKLRLVQRVATRADQEGQLRESSVPLAVALGIEDDFDLTDVPSVPQGLPPPLPDLVNAAKKDRPDAVRALKQWEAQGQAVRIAKSGYYPQLSGTALMQYGNNQFNFASGARSVSSAANPFSGMSGSVLLGLTLSINLFDTLNTYTSVKDARYEEARLWLERKRVELNLSSDVRAAYARLQHLAMQRAPLEEGLALARENVGLVEARYKNGDTIILDFLNAQNDLTDAEQRLTDLMAQLQLAWLELDAALGHVPGDGKSISQSGDKR